MIEIDVRPADGWLTAHVVEASTDGVGFIEQYFRGPVPERRRSAREHAEDVARIFANGCRYAGAEVRMTSCGAPTTVLNAGAVLPDRGASAKESKTGERLVD